MAELMRSVPNWELIQAMYMAGRTPKEIEAKTGTAANTVSVQATRKGWAVALRRLKLDKLAQGQDTEGDTAKPSVLAKYSESARNALGRDLKRICDLIETSPATSLKRALERQAAMEPLIRNSKTVFGWSEGQAQPSVRINVMGSVSFGSNSGSIANQDQQLEQGKVIDTEVLPSTVQPTDQLIANHKV